MDRDITLRALTAVVLRCRVQFIMLPDDPTIYAPEDLIVASKRGKWRKVIDILDHPYFPVSPNAKVQTVPAWGRDAPCIAPQCSHLLPRPRPRPRPLPPHPASAPAPRTRPTSPRPPPQDPVSRQSATYATLLSILTRRCAVIWPACEWSFPHIQAPQPPCTLTRSNGEVALLDTDTTALKRAVRYVSSVVFKESVRLDWVVKILLDRGGDVNFICEERGEVRLDPCLAPIEALI